MAESCTCTNPKFPNLGRPACTIRKKKVAFPIMFPRYDENGVRNVIDATSATLGADITALIAAGTTALGRLYPFPTMEEIKFERTATAYKTMASGKKFKLDGEGGIRTFSGILAGDDGIEPIARQLQTVGCSDFDILEVTVDGSIWGVMDEPNNGQVRGYAVEKETFDAFITRAVDGDINNVMISWDLEDDSDTVNSYAITAEELGYSATTLRPNINAVCNAAEATSTAMRVIVQTDFGPASAQPLLLGLVTANFVVKVGNTVVAATATEPLPGQYVLTYLAADIDPGDVVDVNVVNVTGYAVTSGQFTALL